METAILLMNEEFSLRIPDLAGEFCSLEVMKIVTLLSIFFTLFLRFLRYRAENFLHVITSWDRVVARPDLVVVGTDICVPFGMNVQKSGHLFCKNFAILSCKSFENIAVCKSEGCNSSVEISAVFVCSKW